MPGRGGFESLGQMLRSIRDAGKGAPDIRLKNLTEGTGSEGGFLVPDDFKQEILREVEDESGILARVRQVPVTSRDAQIPAVAETSRQSSVFGGIWWSWTDEAAPLAESQPKFADRDPAAQACRTVFLEQRTAGRFVAHQFIVAFADVRRVAVSGRGCCLARPRRGDAAGHSELRCEDRRPERGRATGGDVRLRKSRVMCWPTSTTISRVMEDRLGALARTVYCPGGKLATSNRPASLVSADREAPVAAARTSTRAPETGRRVLSSILPSTVAKLLCALRQEREQPQ